MTCHCTCNTVQMLASRNLIVCRFRCGHLYHLSSLWTVSDPGAPEIGRGVVGRGSGNDHCSFGNHRTDRFGFGNHRNDRLGSGNLRKLGYDHRDNVRYRGCCSGQLAVRLSDLVWSRLYDDVALTDTSLRGLKSAEC